MRKGIIILLVLLVSCTGRYSGQRNGSDLDAYFSSFFKPDEPGASILIMKNDEVVFSKSYGLADLETSEPITSKTLFNLGSISKTLVAYGILILRDEGKLSLDDPLSGYFREFKNKTIPEKVTIRHLLTHTSGLPDIRNVQADTVFYLTAKDEENWAPIMQADSLNFKPGENYEYSNPAFNALALIIEKVSGIKWQQFIADRIFKPSGMTASTVTEGAHPENGVAHGYVKMGDKWFEDDYGEEPAFAAAGNGGVWSSVDELVFYHRAIRQALFASPETIRESQTVQRPENWRGASAPFIGLCWFIERTPDNLVTIGHTGTQGGFYCHYIYVPEKNVLYVVLANRAISREAFAGQVFARLIEANWWD